MHSAIKSFVKDYNLPIHLAQEPYLSYFLNLYDRDYDCLRKYREFQRVAKSEQAFLEKKNSLIQEVVADVEQIPAYQDFLVPDTAKQYASYPAGSKDLYSLENHHQQFVSIDLRKANFASMRKFNPELVNNCDTWVEFISQYTKDIFWLENKGFRQMIFGKLYPGKQQKIQRQIIAETIDQIKNLIGLELIYHWNNDEIVLKTYQSQNATKWVNQLQQNLDTDIFRIDSFILHHLHKDWYVKDYKFKKQFKKVPAYFFAQAYKYYYKLPLEDYDMLFWHEDYLAKFQEPIVFGKLK